PSPAPIDEVYIKKPGSAKKETPKEEAAKEDPVSAGDILMMALWIFIGIIVLFLLIPTFTMQYFKLRYKKAAPAKDKAYWAYRAATFYLHQVGIQRGDKTPMQFAREVVDPSVSGNAFTSFMNIYLKQKYAKQALNAGEQDFVSRFLSPFISSVKRVVPRATRFGGFLNPVRAISFFVVPENEKQE